MADAASTASAVREARARHLLIGEWACLGIIYPAPTHGFAIAARLKPTADIGRIWSLSRPLTYRSLDQLAARNYIRPVGTEPGTAGPNRTVLAPTRAGRAQFRRWLHTPVEHLRDIRSELLLKLVLAEECGIDITDMLTAQRDDVRRLADALSSHREPEPHDVVTLWRREVAHASLRFLDQILDLSPISDAPSHPVPGVRRSPQDRSGLSPQRPR
jgi:PadR family transcriptional regulator AphA